MTADPLGLAGQVVFVSGGANNIGRASSLLLAKLGATVVITDIQDPAATVAEVEAAGGQAFGLQGDCSQWDTLEAFAAQTLERHGRIDAAVQLVGGGNRSPDFFGDTDEDWDRILRVSLKSHFYLARAVVPAMRRQGGGRIVCISADSGRAGGAPVNFLVYSAAKAGVIGFVKALARELGPDGIAVNSVSPGPTDTAKPGAVSAVVQQATAAIVAGTPMGRRAQPAEVAAAIAFLCSPAAAFITGQVLSVNGGMTMVD